MEVCGACKYVHFDSSEEEKVYKLKHPFYSGKDCFKKVIIGKNLSSYMESEENEVGVEIGKWIVSEEVLVTCPMCGTTKICGTNSDIDEFLCEEDRKTGIGEPKKELKRYFCSKNGLNHPNTSAIVYAEDECTAKEKLRDRLCRTNHYYNIEYITTIELDGLEIIE